ncbi:MAG: Omp28-related outer membrane protein [Rikenellaceae bacterium]
MNNISKFILSLCCTIAFLACGSDKETTTEPNIPDDTTPKELVLVASSEEVVVGPDSYVDFTVLYGEEDVTSEAKIYYEVEGKSSRLDEPRFLVEERIGHLFYAVYNNQISEKVSVVGDLDLMLIPDASPIVVDGTTAVNFTVTASGEDVTDIAKIYHRMSNESADAATWIPSSYVMSQTGEHIFYVVYNGIASDDLLIYGVTNIISKVVDTNPTQYDSFYRRVLAIQGTSTECTWCPHMIKAIEECIDEEKVVEEALIHTAAHGTLYSSDPDPMMCEASMKVIETMGIDQIGYPALNFNMSPSTGFTLSVPLSPADSDGKVDVIKAQITSITESLYNAKANCALSGSSIMYDNIVAVRSDVKIATEGEYFIGAWIIEDGIKSDQYNSTAFPSFDFSTHNNAICATFPSPQSESLFVNLGSVETQKANTEYMFYCEFDLDNFPTIQNIDNCQVVVFVYDNFSSQVDNAIEFPVGGSQAVVYL